MNFRFLFLILNLISASALASPAPAPEGCWPGENTPHSSIIDGTFLGFVTTENLSGLELAKSLRAIQEAGMRMNDSTPEFTVLLGDDTIMFELAATKSMGVSRQKLMESANAEIRELQALPGVKVDCEHRMFPIGGVSGSN